MQKAAAKKAKEGAALTDDERRKLLSTEQSLEADLEPRMPTAMEGLENFTLGQDYHPEVREKKYDADSFFNLPASDDDDDEEEDNGRRRR